MKAMIAHTKETVTGNIPSMLIMIETMKIDKAKVTFEKTPTCTSLCSKGAKLSMDIFVFMFSRLP